jgi:hypothetical protein
MTVTPPGFYRKLLDYQVSTDEILVDFDIEEHERAPQVLSTG